MTDTNKIARQWAVTARFSTGRRFTIALCTDAGLARQSAWRHVERGWEAVVVEAIDTLAALERHEFSMEQVEDWITDHL